MVEIPLVNMVIYFGMVYGFGVTTGDELLYVSWGSL